MTTSRERLEALDPVAAAAVVSACRKKVILVCSRCGGSGEHWGRRSFYPKTCYGCDGTGTVYTMRSDSSRLGRYAKKVFAARNPLEALRGLASSIPGPKRVLSEGAAELANNIEEAAEEAALVQSEIGGPYRGDEPFGTSMHDHLSATADVSAMRDRVREIRGN